jgi:hypothetical protein
MSRTIDAAFSALNICINRIEGGGDDKWRKQAFELVLATRDEWEKHRAALAAAEDALKKERIGRIVERIDACGDKFKETDYEMYLELFLIGGAVRDLRRRWMEVHTERAISECCASMAEAMDEHLKEVTK